jgi:hypothetical protein
MPQLCPRCQKANPEPAVFCWFDGVVLKQGAYPDAGRLPQEFVFPSGRRCRTFAELVQGCQYEWEDARDILRNGQMGKFLATVGRHDLARAAAEAQAVTDPDIALHQFLGQLPTNEPNQGPRLDLHPRRLSLGPLRAGEQKSAVLTVTRQGTGLLQGRVSVTEGGPWLRIANGSSDTTCAVKTGRSQQVNLAIDTRDLSGPRTYSGKLTVVTNGGIAEVPVRLDIGAMPFPKAPFQGAATPRDLAEKMRASPKAAVPLLESGEVARWFRVNGWTYPVAGPGARGVAAVQQFFEGMGLSKPPPLQISDKEMRFLCVPPAVASGKITLRTAAKKWVYAQADSDVPWLKVLTPGVSGPQQAQVGFEIDSSQLKPDATHQGTVALTANAGQRYDVRVLVEVRRPHEPVARRMVQPFVVGAALALLVRLLLSPAEVFARARYWLGPNPHGAGVPLSVATWMSPAAAEGQFLRPFVLSMWWVGVVLGIFLVWRRGGRVSDLFYGGFAGAFAGLLGAATAGCGLLVIDAVPAAVLAWLSAGRLPTAAPPWGWLPFWVLLATLGWAVLGGIAGSLLALLGPPGAAALGAAGAPLAWLLRRCGLERAAAFFQVQG